MREKKKPFRRRKLHCAFILVRRILKNGLSESEKISLGTVQGGAMDYFSFVLIPISVRFLLISLGGCKTICLLFTFPLFFLSFSGQWYRVGRNVALRNLRLLFQFLHGKMQQPILPDHACNSNIRRIRSWSLIMQGKRKQNYWTLYSNTNVLKTKKR